MSTVPLSSRRAFGVAASAALLALALAVAVGSTALPWHELARALGPAGRDDPQLSVDRLVLGLRLARALSAFAVGGLLALSGAISQALLRNPLADPYVLGISGGAAVVAVAALWLGAPALGVQAGSVAGAIGALALLWLLARRAAAEVADDAAVTSVLLTGAMIASLCAALLGLALALAPDGRLRSIVFWLLGDLGGATDLRAALAALALLAGLALLVRRERHALNLLLDGATSAYTRGVDVGAVRWRLILAAAVATGCAVTIAGAVGFVGFMAPHLARRLVGNDQGVLIPTAVLAGGALVVLADTLARSIAAPLQLPVGVVTALLGVPVFIGLLRRG